MKGMQSPMNYGPNGWLGSINGSPQRIRRGCVLHAHVSTPTPAIERAVESNGTNEAPVYGLRDAAITATLPGFRYWT